MDDHGYENARIGDPLAMGMFSLAMAGFEAWSLEAAPQYAVASIGAPPTSRAWAIFLGVAFAAIALSLLIASWTRWGQSKPLAKCIGIAFLAHVWLLLYAYGTRIAYPGHGAGNAGGIATATNFPANVDWSPIESEPIRVGEKADPSDESNSNDAASISAWASPVTSSFEQHTAPAIPPLEVPASTADVPVDEVPIHKVPVQLPEWDELTLPIEYGAEELLQLAELPPEPPAPEERSITASDDLATREIQPTIASSLGPIAPIVPIDSMAMTQGYARSAPLRPVPPAYQMRISPNRTQFAYQNGGDAQTEQAVQRALVWLAAAQSENGSWNAAAHGAGLDDASKLATTEGKYRSNAGKQANTGMTGLALLAFLGAGHTHVDGPYAKTVARGLDYLQKQQFPSGDLSGRDQIGQEATVRYARMYSHGMASLAVSEAYALTGDPALLPTIQSSSRYTLNAMNPRSGGWRYDFASDDPGDTSQFGWQAMLLHSASASGAVQVGGNSRLAMQRFLDSVSTGRAAGLAVYRNVLPNSRPIASAATPAMTAEALAMRSLLGFPITMQASAEARELLLRHLPGQKEENLYYWYYATMALYQLRDTFPGATVANSSSPANAAWVRWNDAMKKQLCLTQLSDGPNAGSWNPTCVWGSYGGRVYSTATACMCLEVYYRYLPLYQDAEMANGQASPLRK
jgi:hypothetical protein